MTKKIDNDLINKLLKENNISTSKSSLILQFEKSILAARKNGITWQKIREILAQGGLSVSLGTLRNTFKDIENKRNKKNKSEIEDTIQK